MQLELTGIHHVTAVTGDVARNVDFYTRVLGMRLVKKTVNQDDVSAYHLFYADGNGSPGTEMTFFDWPHAGANRAGSGEVSTTGLRVPSRAALQWWAQRLQNEGIVVGAIEERAQRATLWFTDPEGQRLCLVEDAEIVGAPWLESSVPPDMAILGLGPVILSVRALEPTAQLLTEVLGFRQANEYNEDLNDEAGAQSVRVVVFHTGKGGAASEVQVRVQPDAPQARNGIGGVHHVAFRAPDDAIHRAWQSRLRQARLGVTPVIDRFYFKSLYFREPGGILFEIATDGPGFATDEDAAHLGESLALPPFLEPRRAQIEAGLRPIPPLQSASNPTTGGSDDE